MQPFIFGFTVFQNEKVCHTCVCLVIYCKQILRELVALLNLSSWCLVMVQRLFLAVPRGCLLFMIVVFPDHTHYFCVIMLCLDIYMFLHPNNFILINCCLVLVQLRKTVNCPNMTEKLLIKERGQRSGIDTIKHHI